MGVPEGEEREQEIEKLFEKIMTENFPNLVKEIDKEVQEVKKVSNKMNPKEGHTKTHYIKMQKVKDKEKILKVAREKQLVTYRGAPKDCSLISQQKLCGPEGTDKKYTKWWKAKSYNQGYSIQKSYHLEWKGR